MCKLTGTKNQSHTMHTAVWLWFFVPIKKLTSHLYLNLFFPHTKLTAAILLIIEIVFF